MIATFPDYGLNYKYGGWHLTRTIAIGAGKLYVSVGSSCNACEEEEPIRATVLEMYADAEFSKNEKKIDCNNLPPAYVGFSAHSSPLGFEYFDSSNSSPALKDSFLVALHGSSKRPLRRGYSLMRVRKGGSVQDFITGFCRRAECMEGPPML